MKSLPAARIDALTDGIFAFAMTLLVLDIRLPDGLPIDSAAELSAHLATLGSEYITYLVSFFVLAVLWRGNAGLRHKSEETPHLVVRVWMLYLFFITSVPFSSSVVGHYGQFAPAIWLYSGNMLVLAVLSLLLLQLEVPPDRRAQMRAGAARLLLFAASAMLSAGIALFEPKYAMYAYLLNGLARVLPVFSEKPACPPPAPSGAA